MKIKLVFRKENSCNKKTQNAWNIKNNLAKQRIIINFAQILD